MTGWLWRQGSTRLSLHVWRPSRVTWDRGFCLAKNMVAPDPDELG